MLRWNNKIEIQQEFDEPTANHQTEQIQQIQPNQYQFNFALQSQLVNKMNEQIQKTQEIIDKAERIIQKTEEMLNQTDRQIEQTQLLIDKLQQQSLQQIRPLGNRINWRRDRITNMKNGIQILRFIFKK